MLIFKCKLQISVRNSSFKKSNPHTKYPKKLVKFYAGLAMVLSDYSITAQQLLFIQSSWQSEMRLLVRFLMLILC